MREPLPAETVPGIPEPGGWLDALTGVEGPDYWQRIVIAEIARATRYRRPMTVVLVAVDGLDEIQRVWGTEVARHTLHETAQCLRRMARTSDHCARIGATWFGVLLTETDEIAAINFVDRVREAGPKAVARTADLIGFTFGWASPREGEAPDAVVRRAEARMAADRTR